MTKRDWRFWNNMNRPIVDLTSLNSGFIIASSFLSGKGKFVSGKINRLAFLKEKLIHLDNDINFQSCPYLDLVKGS